MRRVLLSFSLSLKLGLDRRFHSKRRALNSFRCRKTRTKRVCVKPARAPRRRRPSLNVVRRSQKFKALSKARKSRYLLLFLLLPVLASLPSRAHDKVVVWMDSPPRKKEKGGAALVFFFFFFFFDPLSKAVLHVKVLSLSSLSRKKTFELFFPFFFAPFFWCMFRVFLSFFCLGVGDRFGLQNTP